MSARLVGTDGSVSAADRETVERSLAAGQLLWLDCDDTGAETLTTLAEVFGVHPLAIEDVRHFGQRPKVEDYDDFVAIVAYGARDVGGPMTEVHCFYSDRFLVTVHREDVPGFAEAAAALRRRRRDGPPTRLIALHHVLDTLVDSIFPVLSAFDDRIDALQDEIFARPTDGQLASLAEMKRWLVTVRKLVTPQRDMLSAMVDGVVEVPGMTAESERYFRDLYDHLIRISDLVDSYRDLLSGAMDSYLSIVSNRLNEVMKQLTIIATVFLPLSFLTGFFGQNFAWLVARLGSLPVFFGVGVGTEAVAVVVLFLLFRSRGWIQVRGRRTRRREAAAGHGGHQDPARGGPASA